MRTHHRATADAAVRRLLGEDDAVQAVFLAGSIAKGTDHAGSDVDLIAVTGDAAHARWRAERGTAFVWTDLDTDEPGCADVKLFSRTYVEEAARRGSEPTRSSFLGARPLHGDDPQLLNTVARIPVYPEAERAGRRESFMAQMQLNRVYYWQQGEQRGDRYLKTLAAVRVVTFGGRLLLAHQRVLFSCQKDLMRQVADLPGGPPGLAALTERLLTRNDRAALDAYCAAVETHVGMDGAVDGAMVSRYVIDSEQGWHDRVHDVGEW